MKTTRIVLDEMPARFEWLMRGRLFRFGLALATVALTSGLAILLGSAIGREMYLTLLFVSILLSSVLCGFLPGLLATLLASLVGAYLPPDYLSGPEVRQLAIEGMLVSVVGGTLRIARRKAHERLEATQRLERQIIEFGDEQRQRIGHDLHDGLGQHLTGISLLSETIAQQLEAGSKPDIRHVETITKLVSEAVGLTRDLAKSLSPVTLERDGFLAAIQELSDTTSGLFGIECTLECNALELPLDRSKELHLYRIIQEAMNNSIRHGKAKNVRVTVLRHGDGVSATVEDDGSGLSEKTIHNPGLGLRIMQYRARMLGASLKVERAEAAGGTVMTCVCPAPGAVEHGSAKTGAGAAGG